VSKKLFRPIIPISPSTITMLKRQAAAENKTFGELLSDLLTEGLQAKIEGIYAQNPNTHPSGKKT
jgi:hypothetical protein